MERLKSYQKYYFLEKYLFSEVHENFLTRGYLLSAEFFAIVIWKSNRAKTKVRNGIQKSQISIRRITSEIFDSKSDEQKFNSLTSIKGIGLPIASAILTVCYPSKFTIVDYRAKASLLKFGEKVIGNPSSTLVSYFDYVSKCKKLARKYNCSLREFDRILWGKDFYEGENGLRSVSKGLN